EARAIAAAITHTWARSGSDTADLLMSRAATALRLGDHRLALAIYDRIVTLEPGWTDVWMGRANAKMAAGDMDGAVRDFETAVRLEPRRFDAWAAMGAALERGGAPKRALEAYRRALAIDPQQEEWRKAKERLELQTEGRDI
ncbi:MAG: tetratricopeptide repeat protein, partial [Methylocystis sp.]|nr:tetratricopeptide repeat protein [Methylocystis sp.]